MLVFGVGGPVAQGLGQATVHYKSRQLKKPKFMPRPIGTNNKQSNCIIPCHHIKSSREAASRWATRGTTKLFNGRAYGELGRRELARGFDAPYAQTAFGLARLCVSGSATQSITCCMI